MLHDHLRPLGIWELATFTLGAAIIFGLAMLLRDVFLRPLQIYMHLRAQEIRGPSFIPIVGHTSEFKQMLAEADSMAMDTFSNEIVPRIHPFYPKWSKLYGEPFVYTLGPEVRLVIADPKLMKEVLSSKFGHFQKLPGTPPVRDLFGDGIMISRGEKWVRDRRILNPGFHIDKLKAMVAIIADLATKTLSGWEQRIITVSKYGTYRELEVEVLSEYKTLTADAIARIAFGSNYEESKTVFRLQHEQQKNIGESRTSMPLPGKSFLPMMKKLRRWKINKAIQENLRHMVLKRLQLKSQANIHGNQQQDDLLDIMISAYQNQYLRSNQKKNLRMEMEDIVDQCKTFFFAGQESTSTMLAWTTMLLALHPLWQDRVRAEVFNVCGRVGHPDIDMLNRLEQLDMVLNEALRLYPVAPVLTRSPEQDVKIGDNRMKIPRGTVVCLMLGVMMHKKEVWGEDADEFNPGRFSEGIAKAACRHMPFSVGPRKCIGQAFALMEAKVVLCKLVQRFSFRISPTYKHSPKYFTVLLPWNGVQILLTSLGDSWAIPSSCEKPPGEAETSF